MQQPQEINVAVDAQGHYAIDNVRVSARDAGELAAALTRAVKAGGAVDPVIIINADAMAAHQTVINVLEAARQAGMAKVTFAAQASAK